MTMKVYFPSYYVDFKCIADRCRHSCCIGWEIRVDEQTLKKYRSLGREDILSHIEDGEMVLCDGSRCPFLDERGLCRIISDLGEDYTSVICREHPRFYHRIGDRVEGGIGVSCEEACRIVLSSDLYDEFCEAEWVGEVAEETSFDSLSHREYIYSVLLNKSLSYPEKVRKIKEKYDLAEPIHSVEEWKIILSQLEYLEDSHRELFLVGEGREEYFKIYERFFAYLVFRHLSVAESYDNLRARLGFCLLLCSLLEGYTAENFPSFNKICEHARAISEEIEYSEDNTAELIFEFEANLF